MLEGEKEREPEEVRESAVRSPLTVVSVFNEKLPAEDRTVSLLEFEDNVKYLVGVPLFALFAFLQNSISPSKMELCI